jgi:hypothetical protein
MDAKPRVDLWIKDRDKVPTGVDHRIVSAAEGLLSVPLVPCIDLDQCGPRAALHDRHDRRKVGQEGHPM